MDLYQGLVCVRPQRDIRTAVNRYSAVGSGKILADNGDSLSGYRWAKTNRGLFVQAESAMGDKSPETFQVNGDGADLNFTLEYWADNRRDVELVLTSFFAGTRFQKEAH
jgi:hypothetical protein